MDAAVPWRVRDAWLLLGLGVGVLLLSLLGAEGLYLLQGAPTAVPSEPPAVLTAAITGLFYLTILVGAWLLVVRRYGAGWSALGLRLPTPAALAPMALLALALAGGCVALVVALGWGLAMLGVPAAPRVVTAIPAPSDPLFIPSVLGSVLLTPVAEEILFRGVLYQSLRKRMGVVLGTGVSALVFALLHVQPAPSAAPVFLLLGILLAVAFERTHSLYPSMLLHAAYNGVILLLALGVI